MALRMVQPYKMALDDVGDLNAPHGTAPWARAMRIELRQMFHDGTTQLQRFKKYLLLMETERGYQQLDDAYGHPFPSLSAFCMAAPPYGLGYAPELIAGIQQETREMLLGEKVAEVRALQKHGGDRKSEEFQRNENNVETRGTSSRYQIARLKRDHPAIADALAQGKYPSVHAAAKAAGLVREPTPLDVLARAWKKVHGDDRLRFLTETLTPTERRTLSAMLATQED